MMRELSVISFTACGMALARRLAEALSQTEADWEVRLFTKWSGAGSDTLAVSVSEWAGEQMTKKRALLFIGACGIAVRAVAPWLTDKLHDSPVLAADETGTYVIPLLSGHVGGATELARKLADVLGAIPVITTATDLRNGFAVDLFAQRNDLCIRNKDGIAKVSAKVLTGREITLSVDPRRLREHTQMPEGIRRVPYPPRDPVDVIIDTAEESGELETKETKALLVLCPRVYAIGMGCRRGKEEDQVDALISRTLAEQKIRKEQVFALASVDRKKEEPCFLSWSRKEGIPFRTFSPQQLETVPGCFHGSAFVKQQIGVDNVCERAALLACGSSGTLVYEKHGEYGMTIAIAKREWEVSFE